MAVRALDDADLLVARPDPAATKPEGLSPLVLLMDPAAWYAALDTALADTTFGPVDEPSPISPASRLIDRCQSLTP